MVDPVIGQPHPQHITYPVPLRLMDEDDMLLRAGCGLSGVVPTVLDLLGLPQPAEMTVRSLILSPGPGL
jgi:2,3-bisphosphoglycerate-independent phosphoglycerate mutase